MKAFVLIMFLENGITGDAISQEFNSLSACKNAAEAFNDEAPLRIRVTWICAEKGPE